MNKGATMSLNKLLTTREVAKYLDVAESTIIQYRVNGRVICFVIYWLKKGKSLIIIKYICNKIKTVFQ